MIKIFIIDIITPVEHPGGFQPFLAHADVSVQENEEKKVKIRGSDCLIAVSSPTQGIPRLFLSGTQS